VTAPGVAAPVVYKTPGAAASEAFWRAKKHRFSLSPPSARRSLGIAVVLPKKISERTVANVKDRKDHPHQRIRLFTYKITEAPVRHERDQKAAATSSWVALLDNGSTSGTPPGAPAKHPLPQSIAGAMERTHGSPRQDKDGIACKTNALPHQTQGRTSPLIAGTRVPSAS